MLNVTCPRCGNLHHAQEAHRGKLLKCGSCGDAVQIEGEKGGASLLVHEPVIIEAGSGRTRKLTTRRWLRDHEFKAKDTKAGLVWVAALIAVPTYIMWPVVRRVEQAPFRASLESPADPGRMAGARELSALDPVQQGNGTAPAMNEAEYKQSQEHVPAGHILPLPPPSVALKQAPRIFAPVNGTYLYTFGASSGRGTLTINNGNMDDALVAVKQEGSFARRVMESSWPSLSSKKATHRSQPHAHQALRRVPAHHAEVAPVHLDLAPRCADDGAEFSVQAGTE